MVSQVTLYAKWLREGRLKVDPSKNDEYIVTMHDPCNVVRKARLQNFHPIDDDARYVLSRVVNNYVEPDPSRDNNFCCSGGGGALINGFARARTFYGRVKVDQIKRTGATHVCTPCVKLLRRNRKPRTRITRTSTSSSPSTCGPFWPTRLFWKTRNKDQHSRRKLWRESSRSTRS